MIQPEHEGPPEPMKTKCAYCGEPVLTFWAAGNRGLLNGDYELWGDCVLHSKCAEAYSREMMP